MVSVIINTINEDPETLHQAVQSYLTQGDVEVILSTVEFDPCIGRHEGVKYAIMPRSIHPGKCPRGSFMQLNNALPLIEGDWFCFASGNDYSHFEKLEIEVECCIKNKKEVCYSAFYEKTGEYKKVVKFFDYDFEQHLRGNFVSDCALISRRLVDKYLPFNERLNNYAYWDLWLRIFEGEGDVFCYNPIPTWYYIQNPDDMHVKRRKDKILINMARMDRERMLNLHK